MRACISISEMHKIHKIRSFFAIITAAVTTLSLPTASTLLQGYMSYLKWKIYLNFNFNLRLKGLLKIGLEYCMHSQK